eukprot:1396075-Amphidinium_carterae.1
MQKTKPKARTPKQPWISRDTWTKMTQLTVLQNLFRSVKRVLRSEKRQWLAAECKKIEDTWADSRQAYQLVRRITGWLKRGNGRALHVDGNIGHITHIAEEVGSLWQASSLNV